MKTAWFDCFSGISGDMCLGALVDAGVSPEALKRQLKKLPLKGWSLSVKKVHRCGVAATKVDVITDNRSEDHRKWKDIKKIIGDSALSDSIKGRGLEVFKTLFEAEAAVHGSHFDKIHLHELGAVDCIVDVLGTLIGLEMLGVEAVYSSTLNMGGGTVKCAHGLLPVPAPATMQILKGVPVYSSGGDFEMTTPTGAAIIKTISRGFGRMPEVTIEKAGNGAGGRDNLLMPNLLRLVVGSSPGPGPDDSLIVIETNIDDMNPQVYGYVTDLLLKAGALDVWLTQIMMKKMRPAVKLSALTAMEKLDEISEIILRETSSLGVRYYEVSRLTMERRFEEIKSAEGRIRVKVSSYKNGIRKVAPEYEDCRRVSEKSGIPLIEVMEGAKRDAGMMIKGRKKK